MAQNSDEYTRVKKSELEKLVDRKVKERLKDKSKASSIGKKKRISRRSFLKKMGAGAAGLGILSLTPATSQLKLTKNGVFRDGSALYSKNSYFEGYLSSVISSISAGNETNIIDSIVQDSKNEVNSSYQFVPDETAKYRVMASVTISGNNSGQRIRIDLNNASDSSLVRRSSTIAAGADRENVSLNVITELKAGKKYELLAENLDGSFTLTGGKAETYATVTKSIVGS